MAKYILLYKGEATPMDDMTPEMAAELLDKWTTWMTKVGPALADVGTPFGEGTSLVDDGTDGMTQSLTGYSIVEADNVEGAKAHADGHPYLSEGKGNYAIDIFELQDVPFDPPT